MTIMMIMLMNMVVVMVVVMIVLMMIVLIMMAVMTIRHVTPNIFYTVCDSTSLHFTSIPFPHCYPINLSFFMTPTFLFSVLSSPTSHHTPSTLTHPTIRAHSTTYFHSLFLPQPLMQFGAFMRDEARDRGSDALQVELSFSQKNILEVSIEI